MRILLYISTLLLTCICNSCHAQKEIASRDKIRDGKWISAQDSLDVLIVKGEYTFQYYNKVFKDSAKYYFTKKNCNLSYKSPKNNSLFLILYKEHLCFEVEGITDDYMELTYTANGRTLTYWKYH